MSSNIKAPTSILELLTYPNPPVTHVPRGKKPLTNSKGLRWHTPKVVCEWKELKTDKALKKAFNKTLFKEATARRQLGSYPLTFANMRLRSEAETTQIIAQWSEPVVNAALKSIQNEFHPAIWSAIGDKPDDQKQPIISRRKGSLRARPIPEAQLISKDETIKRKDKEKVKQQRLIPDSGARCVAPSYLSPSSDTTPVEPVIERFPKEYKPSQKWTFAEAAKFIEPDGEVNDDVIGEEYFWPIRQAFTYCLEYECRYGCLMTCHEAFIFRIQPVCDEPNDGDRSEQRLLETLRRNGKMEYLCIPWDNHRQDNISNSNDWTINLALWYIHVLAGNDYRIKWKYGSLVDETLVALSPAAQLSPPSTTSAAGMSTAERCATDDGTESDQSDLGNLDSGIGGYLSDPLAWSFQESQGSLKRKRNDDSASGTDNNTASEDEKSEDDENDKFSASTSKQTLSRSRKKQLKK